MKEANVKLARREEPDASMAVSPTVLRRRERYVPRGVAQVTPVVVATARGAEVVDVDGKTYIDFAGGIGALNVGHCAPKVVEAIKRQADRLLHACFQVATYEAYVNLVQRLSEITPGDFLKKGILVNSGAEAVENAVKIARSFTGRSGVICFEGAFHGRTLLGLSLTSKVKTYKAGFGPFAPEIYRLPYAYCYRCPYGKQYPSCDVFCADALEEFFQSHVSPSDVAALIVEPVLGEGGFVVPPPEYFKKLKAICERHNILFIADEIQTGFGRTGRMFAIEHYGVIPDLIVMAKSLAGGLPLAAVVGLAEVMNAPQVGGLGSTFGGNPLACEAALAVLETITEANLLSRAQTIGEQIKTFFLSLQQRYPLIGHVRGLGAMVALELVTDRDRRTPAPEATRTVVQQCAEKGLIILTAGTHDNIIRALPPLVITDEQLERAFEILEDAFGEVTQAGFSS